MIYAGLTPEDPRVKAATQWIKKHYTVKENPGMGQQGVLYYYRVFAKTLPTMDLDEITDAEGVSHDWRKELAEHLLQNAAGKWGLVEQDRSLVRRQPRPWNCICVDLAEVLRAKSCKSEVIAINLQREMQPHTSHA